MRDLLKAFAAVAVLALLGTSWMGCNGSDDDDDDATADATPGPIDPEDVPGMIENCDPESTDPCEALICSLAEAVQDCEDAGVSEACDPILSCVADYYNCACGTGSYDYGSVQTCSDAYLTCMTEAGWGLTY